jgi:hypothetical protein
MKDEKKPKTRFMLALPVILVLAACQSVVTPISTNTPATPDDYATLKASLAEICGDSSEWGIKQNNFYPEDVIYGPAALFPDVPGANMALADALKLSPPLFGGWGLNIHSGNQVQIPQTINLILLEESQWKPTGMVVYFLDDKQLEDTATCVVRFRSP